jgi:hypothetical protein
VFITLQRGSVAVIFLFIGGSEEFVNARQTHAGAGETSDKQPMPGGRVSLEAGSIAGSTGIQDCCGTARLAQRARIAMID